MTSVTTEQNAFDGSFGDGGGYVCPGDRIEATVDGFHIEAELVLDPCNSPHALDDPECCFWTDCPAHGEENQRILDEWDRDEWHYYGVALSVSRSGVPLTQMDGLSTSLWGIEGNMRDAKGNLLGNQYLTEVANELLPEALEEARRVLATLVETA